MNQDKSPQLFRVRGLSIGFHSFKSHEENNFHTPQNLTLNKFPTKL